MMNYTYKSIVLFSIICVSTVVCMYIFEKNNNKTIRYKYECEYECVGLGNISQKGNKTNTSFAVVIKLTQTLTKVYSFRHKASCIYSVNDM